MPSMYCNISTWSRWELPYDDTEEDLMIRITNAATTAESKILYLASLKWTQTFLALLV